MQSSLDIFHAPIDCRAARGLGNNGGDHGKAGLPRKPGDTILAAQHGEPAPEIE